MLHFALRRSQNIHWQALDVEQGRRAPRLKGQKACVLWFTGLSGAGKSTIANLVEKRLHAAGPPHLPARRRQRAPRPEQGPGLHRRDRVENIRRVAEVAKLMVDAGLIVLVVLHLAVPRRARAWRASCSGRASSSRCSSTRRSPRPSGATQGPLQEGRRGELKNFTGIDSPYEAPENPEIRIDTTRDEPPRQPPSTSSLLLEVRHLTMHLMSPGCL